MKRILHSLLIIPQTDLGDLSKVSSHAGRPMQEQAPVTTRGDFRDRKICCHSASRTISMFSSDGSRNARGHIIGQKSEYSCT